ncbi:metallophosphoesterase [Rhabdobacter roseus]|uniref:3',5'-cyclic AMP phosphodiesterase CpdA n=1 Tax=Rhabdobacter roseus TaxID=1655419 RepID=A0A840TSE1_9BACT|nr:metallophosphoesterase [Rhabdobacter roseus]MBB5282619.1 3',5'-cyclic AMP phosphodiesterase CpdA [Rhabdobacter roseus]
MTIQYLSDLHLEFRENAEYLKANPIPPRAEVLVLAGDVVPFQYLDQHKWFFKYLSDHFKSTYWLPGNHEYYQSDAAYRSGTLHEKIRSNVFLVNNLALTLGQARLLFSTLWGHIGPAHDYLLEANVSDFHRIRYQGKRFSARYFNELHADSMAFLSRVLAEAHPGPTLVATHHVPTLLNYPSQYQGSLLNEAFAVELHDFIESTSADYWIYGHHHSKVPDFSIGRTRLLTNQLGYVQLGEHRGFDAGRVLEL